MIRLTEESIEKKICETKEIIEWLKNNESKYNVTPKKISTKNIIAIRRKVRKSKLAELVNNFLKAIIDETELELYILLYMLDGCIGDYQKCLKLPGQIARDDDIRTRLPNLIVNKFPGLWKRIKKSNESTAVKSNLGMINDSSTSGRLKEKEFSEYFDVKNSENRKKELEKDFEKIKRYVKALSIGQRKSV